MAAVTEFKVSVVENDLDTLLKLAPPLVETLHWTFGVGEPVAAALKLAFDPALTLTLAGFKVTTGADDEAAPAKPAVKKSDTRQSADAPANTRPFARRTLMATPTYCGTFTVTILPAQFRETRNPRLLTTGPGAQLFEKLSGSRAPSWSARWSSAGPESPDLLLRKIVTFGPNAGLTEGLRSK
jgi:hypothetical protein